MNDLKSMVAIKIDYRIAEKEQELENLFKIAQAIFGKGENNKQTNVRVIDTLEGAMGFMSALKNG